LPGKGIFPEQNYSSSSSNDLFLAGQYQNSKISSRNGCMQFSFLLLPYSASLSQFNDSAAQITSLFKFQLVCYTGAGLFPGQAVGK
jgi:hypothetical protein